MDETKGIVLNINNYPTKLDYLTKTRGFITEQSLQYLLENRFKEVYKYIKKGFFTKDTKLKDRLVEGYYFSSLQFVEKKEIVKRDVLFFDGKPVTCDYAEKSQITINGQLFFQTIKPSMHAFIVKYLKNFFRKNIQHNEIPFKDLVSINITFRDKNCETDPDNHIIYYLKCISDILVERNYLTDDSRKQISGFNITFIQLPSTSKVNNQIQISFNYGTTND